VHHLDEVRVFEDRGLKQFWVHDALDGRIVDVNVQVGGVVPGHRNPADGQVSIQVIEGSGQFLGENETALPAVAGDILVSDINEPHGVKADTDMRILVTIAPPF